MSDYELFERDFIVRTLKIIEQYDRHVVGHVQKSEQFEITLLINCLLGLLVLPKERCYAQIPYVPVERFGEWGLPPDFIRSWGNGAGNPGPKERDLAQVIHRMRNSVAHLRVEAHANSGEIAELEFSDRNGFRCVAPVSSLKMFVMRLAQSVAQ